LQLLSPDELPEGLAGVPAALPELPKGLAGVPAALSDQLPNLRPCPKRRLSSENVSVPQIAQSNR